MDRATKELREIPEIKHISTALRQQLIGSNCVCR
jgi:hypothetical protein